MRKIIAVDMFCGAGGTSTGLAQACEKLGLEVELTAINHWKVAIATHTKNHPWARHINSNIEKLDPYEVVPGKRVDLLVASPECRYHSTARGGRPVHDQKRASAWYILRWAELLYIKNILIENVPEFRKWGPLNSKGKRIKSLEGTTYQAFLQSLRSLGYHVEERVLNAADYGDATTRKRLFIIARRHSKIVTWPKATHAPIQNGLPSYKSAREVIDWSIPGESIFGRKRPLAPKTIDRIAEGLKKFAGPYAEPFLAILRGTGKARSIKKPIPALTAQGNHVALCQPFLLSHRVFDRANVDSIDKPMRTITSTARDISMAQAFIIPNFGEKKGQKPRTHDLDKPLPAATSHGAGGLVEAFILPRKGYYQSTGNVPRSIDKPLPTATSRGGGFLVQPYIVGTGGPTGSGRPRSTDKPLKTVLTNNRSGMVQPYLVKVNHGGEKRQAHDIGKPMPTLTAKNGFAVIAPMLVKYFGTGRAKPTGRPMDTLTTKDRMGLAVPLAKGDYAIDILFRMLNPSELARAMSFPEGYQFVGKKEDIVKQIGNAVAVGKARALCMAILKNEVRR